MEDKQILNSQTIRGAIQLIIVVLGLLGVQISHEEAMSISDVVVNVGVGLYAIYAFVQVVIGRIKANRNLKIGTHRL